MEGYCRGGGKGGGKGQGRGGGIGVHTCKSKEPPAAPPSRASMPSRARPALPSVSMGPRHMSTSFPTSSSAVLPAVPCKPHLHKLRYLVKPWPATMLCPPRQGTTTL